MAGTHQGHAHRDVGDRRHALGSAGADPHDGHHRGRHRRGDRPRRGASAPTSKPSRALRRSSTKFTKKARTELGAAGTHLLAERAEKLREDWVRAELVDAGRARAQALGWPDAYAFTKALGERVLVTAHPDIPTTVVRPSIIESALAEPRPGWIRGFRMAEPIIISYARGLLKEFPGIPEGVADVIPVDMVVAAIIACAAAGPGTVGPTRSSTWRRASGTRSATAHLVELVQSWFTEHPLYDSDGQPIVVPDWSFPGRGRVQRQLQRANLALGIGREVARLASGARRAGRSGGAGRGTPLPRRAGARVRGALRRLHRDRGAVPGRPAARALGQAGPADRELFCFDPACHRLGPTTCTRSTSRRWSSTPGSGRRSRAIRRWRAGRTVRRSAILSPERHLAAFDLENTLVASNVVESYAWLATRHLPARRPGTGHGPDPARGARACSPSTAATAATSCAASTVATRARPRSCSAHDATELFHNLLLAKLLPCWLRPGRRHRALGHRTVLITGALDFVVEPMRPLFDEVVCAQLGRDADGRLTGRLDQLPPTGEARALVLAEYAAAEGLDLGESIAYADSASDLPLLECVGFPVAVNPEAKLAAIARRRGWHTEHWDQAEAAARRCPRSCPDGPASD